MKVSAGDEPVDGRSLPLVDPETLADEVAKSPTLRDAVNVDTDINPEDARRLERSAPFYFEKEVTEEKAELIAKAVQEVYQDKIGGGKTIT